MGGRSSRGAARGAGGAGLLNGIAGIGRRRRASRRNCGRTVTSRQEPRPPGNHALSIRRGTQKTWQIILKGFLVVDGGGNLYSQT